MRGFRLTRHCYWTPLSVGNKLTVPLRLGSARVWGWRPHEVVLHETCKCPVLSGHQPVAVTDSELRGLRNRRWTFRLCRRCGGGKGKRK